MEAQDLSGSWATSPDLEQFGAAADRVQRPEEESAAAFFAPSPHASTPERGLAVLGQRPQADSPDLPPRVAAADAQAATRSTSLDPHERNPHSSEGLILDPPDVPRDDFRVTPLTITEAEFRHSGWKRWRQKAFEALVTARASSNRLDRFCNCGSGCYVQHSPSTGAVRLAANYCHDRFCIPCGTARGHKIARAVENHIRGRYTRFVTLTLRHNHLSLSEQVDRIYSCFSALRRRKWWKRHIDGGAAFLEIKHNGTATPWHVHLHMIVEGKYSPQKELAHEWYACTGDSSIVDIRSVTDVKEVAHYVTKYVSKPMDQSLFTNAEALVQCIVAVKGRHTCLTFGTWRKLHLEEDPPDPGDWHSLGSLAQLLADAQIGDTYAQMILLMLKSKGTFENNTSIPPPEPPC